MSYAPEENVSLWTRLDGLLQDTSRTFSVGIQALPSGLRQEVTVAYLILRVSDYLEDNEVMSPEAKADALARWRDVLSESGDVSAFVNELEVDGSIPDAKAVVAAEEILHGLDSLSPEAAGVIRCHTMDSTTGMAEWAVRGPDFETEEDLDAYMHEVAGRVGYLLTDLFALRYPGVARKRAELLPLARHFGLALQTVNVVRGLSTDHTRGWVFVPRAFMEPGTPFAQILAAPGDAPAMALLARLTDKAALHLEAAERYVDLLPRTLLGLRVFCLIPYFLAVRTLALSRGNPAVFSGEVKVPRPEVMTIVRRSRLLFFSNGWIQRFARRLDAAHQGVG